MQRKISRFFRSKKNRILSIKGRGMHLYDWPRVRNPVRVIWNYIIIRVGMIMPLHVKVFMYRYLLGMNIGKRVSISPFVEFDYFYPELISIDDDVIIGMHSVIFTHEFTHSYYRFGRVRIGKKALVGAFARVRCGVSIGAGSTIAIESLVNKDIPSGETWGGIPCKKIR